jgi:hypothetical protein
MFHNLNLGTEIQLQAHCGSSLPFSINQAERKVGQMGSSLSTESLCFLALFHTLHVSQANRAKFLAVAHIVGLPQQLALVFRDNEEREVRSASTSKLEEG